MTTNTTVKISIWHNCYDETLKAFITPASFAHPAKMAKRLCERIFEYGEAEGYWSPGDVLVDPFGGIGTTGLIGAYRGYRVVSIELEPRFVQMQQANIDRNAGKLKRLGKPLPIVIQGDARRLSEIVHEAIGSVFSPPYADGSAHTGGDDPHPERMTGGTFHGVGLNGAISSPPYSDSLEQAGGIDPSKSIHTGGPHSQMNNSDTRYGVSEGQIGVLHEGEFESVVGAVTSPPWEDGLSNDRVDPAERVKLAREMGVSNAEHISAIDMERIGKRPNGYVSGSVTSPPYSEGLGHGGVEQDIGSGGQNTINSIIAGYGETAGQIGAESGETYWQAMRQVYAELYRVLRSPDAVSGKPGGVAAIVVKDFVRNKQRVPLCDMTAQLLEAIGFTVIERTRAMLVKETYAGVDMFSGEHVTKRTERKSFFRRLAERNGSPAIDYEEVLWARKTLTP